jgi:hypothetical protein
MKHKFDGIDTTQVLYVDKGVILLAGQPISEIEVQNLKEEVKALKNFRMWRILQETVRVKAIEKGLLNATNWEETLSGKMMLHNLGLLKSIVDVIDTYAIPQKPLAPPKRAVHLP